MSNDTFNRSLLPAVQRLVRLASGCDVLKLNKRNFAAVNALEERFNPVLKLNFVKRAPCKHYQHGGAGVWSTHKSTLEDWCLRHRRELTDVFELDENDNILGVKPGACLYTAAGLDAHVVTENSNVAGTPKGVCVP